MLTNGELDYQKINDLLANLYYMVTNTKSLIERIKQEGNLKVTDFEFKEIEDKSLQETLLKFPDFKPSE